MRLNKSIFSLCVIAMTAGATPPPIPARPQIANIQALPDGALYAVVNARGLYRPAEGGAWKQLIESAGMGAGRRFTPVAAMNSSSARMSLARYIVRATVA